MVNQLLGQDATRRARSGRVRLRRRALRHGRGARRRRLGRAWRRSTADAAQVADARLRRSTRYPVARYALTLPKIGVYTGGTTAPTNPAFHGHRRRPVHHRPRTARCMFDLTAEGGHPDLADRPDHVDRPRRRSAREPAATPRSSTRARRSRPARARRRCRRSSTAAAPTSVRSPVARRALRNAGITTVNTNTVNGLTTPGSTFDATWNTDEPGRLGLRRWRLDLPRDEQRPRLRPDDAGRGDGGSRPTLRRTTAVGRRVRQLLRLRRSTRTPTCRGGRR